MESVEAVTVQPSVSLQGFQFHSRCQKIDWRKIASVDIEKVAQEVDVETLQANINQLTYCDIEAEVDTTTVDPNFIKLFKMAQLSIEFLIHSQEALLQSLTEAEEQLVEVNRGLEEERKFRICDQESIRQLQRENRKRKRIIENQQLEMLHGDKLARCGTPCPYCRKIFLSLPYLQAHVVRRHPGQAAPTRDLLSQFSSVTLSKGSTPDLSSLPKEIQELRNLLQREKSELRAIMARLRKLPPQTENESHDCQEDSEKEELRSELECLRQKYNDLAHSTRHSPFTATEGTAQDIGYRRLSSTPACDKEVHTAPTVFDNSGTLEQRLARQLEQQKMEMKRFLAKQELSFQEKVNALSRDLVCLSKTSMNLEKKLSQLQPVGSPARLPTRTANNLALGATKGVRLVAQSGASFATAPDAWTSSSHRFPQGTMSGPMPVPRQRVSFHSKALRKPPSFAPSCQDSASHLKNHVTKGSCETGQPSRQFLFDNKTMKERMKSAVRSTPNLIDALKEEIMDLTKNKLSSMGVNLENPVTNTIFRDCSRKLKSERKLLAKREKHFLELRNQANQQADRVANRMFSDSFRNLDFRRESFLSLGSVEEREEVETKNTSGMSNISTSSSDDEKESVEDSNGAVADSARMYPSQVRGRRAGALSPDVTKPLISSDDEEGRKPPRLAPSSRGGREISDTKTRPPTRISDLVHSIESQLMKRTSRPPKGSVDIVEFKEVVPISLHAGDQRSHHPLLKKEDVPVASSPGMETRDGGYVTQNYSDDDAEGMEEVS